jgi:hypothetical protein
MRLLLNSSRIIVPLLLGVAVVALVLDTTPSPSDARSPGICARFAAPGGSDAAPGTLERPFRSVQRLANSLPPGGTGCAREGTYREEVTVSRGGRRGAPTTVSSYPGERARLSGRVVVERGADHVVLSHLDLAGTGLKNDLPSPTVNANDVTFEDNDVSNGDTTICFIMGAKYYGRADRFVIRRNRIHDCGVVGDNEDHGIYINAATDGQILDNVIYDNHGGRGIQMRIDARRTRVAGNIIDGNSQGVLFGNGEGSASNDNIVENNVISNATTRHNVESYYGTDGPVGRGNVVRRNCLYGGASSPETGGLQQDRRGFAAYANLVADPMFADRSDKDFRLSEASACRVLFLGLPPALLEADP